MILTCLKWYPGLLFLFFGFFSPFQKLGSVGLSMGLYWPDPPLKALSQHWESEKQMKNGIKILAHCHGCGCTNAINIMCMDGTLCVRALVGVWAAVNTRPCLHQPQSFPLHLTFPSPKSEHPEYPRKPLTSGFWDRHSFAFKSVAYQFYSILPSRFTFTGP